MVSYTARLWSVMALLLWTGVVLAERLTFDRAEQWQRWQMPYGLVQIGEEGALRLVAFRKEINAVDDAPLFRHITQTRGEVSGGIWAAGSNPGTAGNIIDGDPQTVWKPDFSVLPKKWFVDIDLGRAVLARQIRLTFPDREGARPFRQFTVYATTGARIQATEDVFKYRPMYRTSQTNHETSIVIPLEYAGTDSTMILDTGMDVDRIYESRYRIIQFISIVVEAASEDAALAEVEVLAVGDNVSIGTSNRGAFVNGEVAVDPKYLFDGNMNTYGVITSGHTTQGSKGGWKESGQWWGVDLGAVFWVDDLFLYNMARDEGVSGYNWSQFHSGSGHIFFYSAGERSIDTALPVPEALDYTELVMHDAPDQDGLFQLRYLFKLRKMRYLFWRGITDQGWNSRPMELMLFSPGYPAQVALKSDFIDLGEISGDDRPKVINAIHWNADLPTDTKLQLRSRSGNSMEKVYTFYDKKGTVVTEEKWNSIPKVIRGLVDTTVVVGEDWGAWSNVYQFSGEPFQSESPRRFVQLEMILSSDDPAVAPQVHSLSIEYEEALLQEAKGSVLPRHVRPNEETRFTYSLWPRAEAGDSGFDLLRLTIPNMTGVADVAVRTEAGEIVPKRISSVDDSLLITLPAKITDDSLQIGFTTRVFQNATLFSLDLGDSDRPHLWQSVVPSERRANVILLPGLADSGRLIGDLQLSSPVLTPNGDGVNDQVEVRFVVYKLTAAQPRVQVYDVSGRFVADLESTLATATHQVFAWSGRDRSGALVPPGVYLCRVDLAAASGEDTELQTFVVAY